MNKHFLNKYQKVILNFYSSNVVKIIRNITYLIILFFTFKPIIKKNDGAHFYQKYNNYTIERYCNHDLERSQKTFDFITLKTNTFNCKELIESQKEGIKPHTFSNHSQWYYSHYYASQLMRLSWWIFGESWNSVHLMSKIFSSFYVILIYFLLAIPLKRSPLLRAFITMTFAQNYHFYNNILCYRDLLKAPFAILLLYLLTLFYRKDYLKAKQDLLFTLLLGLIYGVSLGIRMDFKIFFPLIIVLIISKFLFHRSYFTLIPALALFWVGTQVTSYPQRSGFKPEPGNVGHVINLGWAAKLNRNFLYNYTVTPSLTLADDYVFEMMGENAKLNNEKKISLYNTEMGNHYNNQYSLNILKYLPGYVFHRIRQTFPALLGNWLPIRTSQWIKSFVGYSIFLTCLILLLLLPMKLWIYYFFSTVFLIFPMFLQFSGRHFFHMIPIAFFLSLNLIQDYLNLYRNNNEVIGTNLIKILSTVLLIFIPNSLMIIDNLNLQKYKEKILKTAPVKKLEPVVVKKGISFPIEKPQNEFIQLISLKNCKDKKMGFNILYFGKPKVYKNITTIETDSYVIHSSVKYPLLSVETTKTNKDCIEFYRYSVAREGLFNLRLSGEI